MRRIGPDVVFARVVALVTGELFRWRGLVQLGNFTGVVWVRRALTRTCGSMPQLLGKNDWVRALVTEKLNKAHLGESAPKLFVFAIGSGGKEDERKLDRLVAASPELRMKRGQNGEFLILLRLFGLAAQHKLSFTQIGSHQS